MIPWVIVDAETALGGTRLELARRGDEWEVRADRATLMSNRAHGSEDALPRLALREEPHASGRSRRPPAGRSPRAPVRRRRARVPARPRGLRRDTARRRQWPELVR